MIGANWLVRTLGIIFIGLFDGVAYTLVSLSYRIFLAVSELDLFGGSEAGQNLYNIFTQKIYMILSIVMLFVLVYEIILMIINPDGDGTKKATTLFKDVVISISLIAVLPTLFRYMAVFQQHVIHNNTIGAIVLGTSPTPGDQKEYAYGDRIGMVVLMAFYHPQGTGYDSFFDTLGNFRGADEAVSSCVSDSDGAASEDTCRTWAEALERWDNQLNAPKFVDLSGFNSITWNWSLLGTIGDDDGSYYMWIISTVCAIMVAKFFAGYAIDLGTRAVKLGFLELIAPIPIIMNVSPKLKKSFETWKGEIIKTYVELFIRLAVIFFTVKLCSVVPQLAEYIFGGNSTVEGGLGIRTTTMVILILGLLKFAKEAPELFKSLFDTGGNLFKGLDLKPGIKRRIEGNEYAMKGMSTALGAVGGMAGAAYKRFQQAGGSKDNVTLGNVFTALTAAPRGVVTGAKSGWKNSASKLKDLKKTGATAIGDAHAAEQRAYDGDFHSAVRDTYRAVKNDNANRTNAEDSQTLNDIKTGAKQYAETVLGKGSNGFKEMFKDLGETLSGTNITISSRDSENIESMKKFAETLTSFMKDPFDKAIENSKKAQSDDIKKVLNGIAVDKTLPDGTIKTLRTEKEVKAFWSDIMNKQKAAVINKDQIEVLSSQFKKFEKDLASRKMDSSIIDSMNSRIADKAKKMNFKDENGNTVNIKNLEDFIKYTSSDYARSNTEMFVKAISVMGEVGDFFDETGKINNLQSRTQTIAKEAEKKDKK